MATSIEAQPEQGNNEFEAGQKVKRLSKSKNELEDGWEVVVVLPSNEVIIAKGEGVNGRSMSVPLEDLRKWNS